ncbi:MAG TPA: FtsX-like permease family protein, partial [Candidatus Binataceae bacterium]|nr:FtsX-like permease family protein [Candidatus Binataceae bacterium]
YDAHSAQEAFLREVLRRAESLPGVQAAGISTWSFFLGPSSFPSDTAPQQRVIRESACSPGYLKALGVRLIGGRWPSDTDPATNVVLNQGMARQAFGAADPIGKQISIPGPVTVVGVVSDLNYSRLDADPAPEVYIPYRSFPILRGMDLEVRTAGDALTLAQPLRKLLSEIDRGQPAYDVQTLEQALADSIAPRRFNLFLLGTFAAAALLLAVVGVYGVIAYSVAERTREIGVRIALGAQSTQVIRMVVREGITIALAGTAAGLAAAFALTRLMQSLLYEVRSNDPSTFAFVAAALIATALAASCLPALRAARIDPIIALRYE